MDMDKDFGFVQTEIRVGDHFWAPLGHQMGVIQRDGITGQGGKTNRS